MKKQKLTAADRGAIEILLKNKYTPKKIAAQLGVHKSTIYREIKRNGSPNEYVAKYAQANSDSRKAKSKRRTVITHKVRDCIFKKLMVGWSPEQISGWYKEKGYSNFPGYETIYKFIYSDPVAVEEKWFQYLRYARKKRKKKYSRKVHCEKIANKVSIHERDEVVNERTEFGHWEGDSVIFKNKKAVNTLNELKSGFVVFSKLERKTAALTGVAMVNHLKKHLAKTVTVDNGTEFAFHEQIAQESDAKVYFCDPYSSWQRGANENCNMLLRGFLPKGSEIDKLTQEELNEIADCLNERPRKRLGFKTPKEVYLNYLKNQKVAIATGM